MDNNNTNNNNNHNNNNNNNNNNNSSNVVIIKSIKNAKSKCFLLLPDLSRKRMVLFKGKKNAFYFFIKIKIKAANQCSLIAWNVLVIKKTNNNNNKQTKKNQGKYKQIKNGNNSTHHEPLSEEWIGRKS